MNNFKIIEKSVEAILRDNPKTRDDYQELVFAVWNAQGLNLTLEQKAVISRLIPTESITRAARKIWERGEYLPSPHVRRKRRIKETEFREAMRMPEYEWDNENNVARRVA